MAKKTEKTNPQKAPKRHLPKNQPPNEESQADPMIQDQEPYDQTLAGCEAIAQAVLQTRAAVQGFQASAQEAMSNAKAMYAEVASKYSVPSATRSPEEAIATAMDAEMNLIQTMAQSVEKAQIEAHQSMAAAMAAVGGSAGSGTAAGMAGGNLEQATLQAIQAMASAQHGE